MELKEIALENIRPPERNDKLHPIEDEDEQQWEEFRTSVGTEPQKPLEVTPTNENGFYELLDGDRRFRALKQNEAETAQCLIKGDGDDEKELSEVDKTINIVRANEFRKPSDKMPRSRHVAQVVAPWLLPPGERKFGNEAEMTQTEYATQVGATQPTVSRWLQPMKNEYPLRDVLSIEKMVSSHPPDAGETETIDNTVNILDNGSEDGSLVISVGQKKSVSSELGAMKGVSLGEIQQTAKKASKEGWNASRFLEYIDEQFAYDESIEEEVEAGMMDGSGNPFEDDPFGHVEDTGVSVDDVEADKDTEDEEEPDPIDSLVQLAPEVPAEINWENLVDDSDLKERDSVADLKNQRMTPLSLEDDAAIGLHLLASKYNTTERDITKKLLQPIIVQTITGALQEN